MISVRERPSLRLSASIQTDAGHVTRWAADEWKPETAISGLTFSSTMPGGFEACAMTLLRRPQLDYQDLKAFATLTLAGPGGQVAWQGRLNRVPRTSGDNMSVGPDLVGWQAHLDDDKTVRCIFLDIDLTHWQGPSVQRQVGAFGSAIDVTGPSVQTDQTSGYPSLKTALTGAWARTSYVEGWYDAHNVPLAKIGYAWKIGDASMANPIWFWGVYFCSDDHGDVDYDVTSNLESAGPGLGWFDATTSTRKFGTVQVAVGAGGVEGREYPVFWTDLVVIGNHGLPLIGDLDYTPGSVGLYASDILSYAVSQWSPKLAVTRGGASTIQPSTTYVIPHLVFLDPTTTSEIVKQATSMGLLDWAVWEGPTFYCAERGYYGRKWRARVGPSGLAETGTDATTIFNAVTVTFQDVTGITRMVGPSGSGADYIDDSLLDADPQNPATLAGLNRHGLLTMGIVSTPTRAIDVGKIFLGEQRLLNTSGQATLTGHVEDNHGVLWPAWMVRAGDYITFTDAHDTTERRIVRASYSDSDKTCSIDLDAPPDGLAELLQRLGASVKPLGF